MTGAMLMLLGMLCWLTSAVVLIAGIWFGVTDLAAKVILTGFIAGFVFFAGGLIFFDDI